MWRGKLKKTGYKLINYFKEKADRGDMSSSWVKSVKEKGLYVFVIFRMERVRINFDAMRFDITKKEQLSIEKADYQYSDK